MRIEGTLEYNNNGTITKETFLIDTAAPSSDITRDQYDATAYALFGKTIFQDIIKVEKGIPVIVLEFVYREKKITVIRQPRHWYEDSMGALCPAAEKSALKTETEEYLDLTPEKYYNLLKGYLPITYHDFASLPRKRIMQKYRCPICGNTERVEIRVMEHDNRTVEPYTLLCFDSYLDYFACYANCDAFACTTCGFVSLFAPGIARFVKNNFN